MNEIEAAVARAAAMTPQNQADMLAGRTPIRPDIPNTSPTETNHGGVPIRPAGVAQANPANYTANYASPVIQPNATSTPTPFADSVPQISTAEKMIKRTSTLAGGTSGSNTLQLNIKSDGGSVGYNLLNDYMDVMYNVNLSMLPEAKAYEVQTRLARHSNLNVDDIQQQIKDSGSVSLASTGDIMREKNPGPFRNYYNIVSFTVSNVYAPSPQNPLISTMLDMKMKIVEPHGFRLHEDIKALADSLGYTEVNPGRIIYRVDVWFSGYDQTSGAWIPMIPLNKGSSKQISYISYYVAIAAVEAKMTSSGSEYECSMVPMSHFTYRPEEMVIQANNVWTSESNTFGGFLDQLEKSLHDGKWKNTDQQINRVWKFWAPSFLRDCRFLPEDQLQVVQSSFTQADLQGGGVVLIGNGMDILSLLQAALADLPRVNELFLAEEGNPAFLIPRLHWTIRFNTLYGDANGKSTGDPKLWDYGVITHEYIIEPFITYKKGTVSADNIIDYVDPTSQIERVREIVRFGMLIRVYNWIYTAENVDVIDFDVSLKAFYYETLNTRNENQANLGARVSTTAKQTEAARLARRPNTASVVFQGMPTANDALLNRLLGKVSTSALNQSSALTKAQAWAINGGGQNQTPSPDYFSTMTGTTKPLRNRYNQYLDDHLKNDLMSLDLSIRGDPVWLLSPYASDRIETFSASISGDDDIIQPHASKVIFLRFYAPAQGDYMDPARITASRSPNLMGGFYEITSITSTFDGGSFTQKLQGVKLNHLNYVETFLGSEATPAFSTVEQVASPVPANIGLGGGPVSNPTNPPPGAERR